ncbi:MAG: hypothetical protein AABW49_01270 [Nanoarchaeota archaeon]
MGVYRNSTEVVSVHGIPMYMNDIAKACLRSRLNLFLQGDTGSGKTQLAHDMMGQFGFSMGDGKLIQTIADNYQDRVDQKITVAMDTCKLVPTDRTLFVLGRNDMETRDLFQRFNLHRLQQKRTYDLEPLVDPLTGEINWYYPLLNNQDVFVYRKISNDQAAVVRSRLESLAGTSDDIRELTSKIDTNLIVVDEITNCVPAVRAQLFNLFDGFIEIGGNPYPIGGGYSVGIATGNIGPQFTESSNELGRALLDRMHVIIDVDHFFPQPSDTLEILAGNTDPRVVFDDAQSGNNTDVHSGDHIIKQYHASMRVQPSLQKLLVANYLLHGLSVCIVGGMEVDKREMKDAWPNKVDNHEKGSDEALIFPVSLRAAKSILRLSNALDGIALEKGAESEVVDEGYLDSMMQAFKLVGAYSGILNEGIVRNTFLGDRYAAMDAVIQATHSQFEIMKALIYSGLKMVHGGRSDGSILDKFTGRWKFMRSTLEGLSNANRELS